MVVDVGRACRAQLLAVLCTVLAIVGSSFFVATPSHAEAKGNATSQPVPDGDFVILPNKDLYRIAGGAPLYLKTYDSWQKCKPTCKIHQLNDLGGFNNYPADGTILRALQNQSTGPVLDRPPLYKVAGGAPIYLTTCAGPFVCDVDAVIVDQFTIDNLGAKTAGWETLRQYPADNTVLWGVYPNDDPTRSKDRLDKTAGGAALWLSSCTPSLVCDHSAFAFISQDSLRWDILGADPRPGAPRHLRRYPADGTKLAAYSWLPLPEKYTVAGGAPLHIPCGHLCVRSGIPVPQGTIDALGGPPNDSKRLLPWPDDGTVLKAIDANTGGIRFWIIAGGAPLWPLGTCGIPCGTVVSQGTIDELDHMQDIARWPTVIYGGFNPDYYRLVAKYGAERGWLQVPQSTVGSVKTEVGSDALQLFSKTDPVGKLSLATYTSGGLHVRGWALDPEIVEPINVSVRVDGVPQGGQRLANKNRPDIRWEISPYGQFHGFDEQIALTLASGPHNVCVVAIDVHVGKNVQLPTCKTVTG